MLLTETKPNYAVIYFVTLRKQNALCHIVLSFSGAHLPQDQSLRTHGLTDVFAMSELRLLERSIGQD